MKKLLAIILVLSCIGCVSDATKRTNEQNYHAGMKVANESTTPELKQAGADIAANAGEIAKDIGIPKFPAMQYTPELSAKARQDSATARENRSWFIDTVLGGLSSNLPYVGMIITGALAWWTRTKKALGDKKLGAVYAGVEKVLDTMKNDGNGGAAVAKKMIDTLRETASAYNVYPDIKSDLNKMRGA